MKIFNRGFTCEIRAVGGGDVEQRVDAAAGRVFGDGDRRRRGRDGGVVGEGLTELWRREPRLDAVGLGGRHGLTPPVVAV